MAIDVKTGAAEEPIDGGGGSQIFVRSRRPASAPRALVVVCHGVYHDLLNDFGKETVMDDMKGGIGGHLS